MMIFEGEPLEPIESQCAVGESVIDYLHNDVDYMSSNLYLTLFEISNIFLFVISSYKNPFVEA